MSRRLPRLSLRFVAAAALLGCLVSALPFRGQVHAASVPQATGVIPLNHHLTLSRATFIGTPGATITVGANGVITVAGTTGPVQVKPTSGYVLALFNPSTGQFEAVRNNTIRPGTGPYALISWKGVPHVTALSIQMTGVRGGRTAACKPAHNRKGAVLPGCQIVTATAPPRSKLRFTVTYAGHPKWTQHFVVTVDAHGRYHGAFPVTYKLPAGSKHGVPVTVTVVDTLPDGAYGGTQTNKFVDMPAPGRPKSASHSTKSPPHKPGVKFEMLSVRGGRTAPCKPARDRQGHVLPGCQIVTVTAPAQSHLSFTVSYPAAPKLRQSFVAAADARGHYQGAFPVLYNPAAHNGPAAIVRVFVRVTLPNGSYWGTTELCFIDSPAPSQHH